MSWGGEKRRDERFDPQDSGSGGRYHQGIVEIQLAEGRLHYELRKRFGDVPVIGTIFRLRFPKISRNTKVRSDAAGRWI